MARASAAYLRDTRTPARRSHAAARRHADLRPVDARRRRPAAQFVLMDVQQQRIVVYVYELFGDEVKVKKIEHQKAPVQVA